MTHSLSTFDADRPPAMYRSATLAMVVSSTSMNVGMTTATAINQGLIAGRLGALGARVSLLMRRLSRPVVRRRMNRRGSPARPRSGRHGISLGHESQEDRGLWGEGPP